MDLLKIYYLCARKSNRLSLYIITSIYKTEVKKYH
jgi:hypothetical protein